MLYCSHTWTKQRAVWAWERAEKDQHVITIAHQHFCEYHIVPCKTAHLVSPYLSKNLFQSGSVRDADSKCIGPSRKTHLTAGLLVQEDVFPRELPSNSEKEAHPPSIHRFDRDIWGNLPCKTLLLGSLWYKHVDVLQIHANLHTIWFSLTKGNTVINHSKIIDASN